MKTNEMEILRSKVSAIVNQKLGECTSPINPTEFGEKTFNELSEDAREELAAYQAMAVKAVFINVTRRLTKPGDHSTEEMWPLDDWISSADSDKRVMYRHAVWPDHLAHRENQILSMRRQNASFEADEQRRAQLSEVGMASDPTMTTEDAISKIG